MAIQQLRGYLISPSTDSTSHHKNLICRATTYKKIRPSPTLKSGIHYIGNQPLRLTFTR
jgi:hypothetical protein